MSQGQHLSIPATISAHFTAFLCVSLNRTCLLKKKKIVFLTGQLNWDFSNIPKDQMSAGLQKHSEKLVNNLMDA